MPILKANDEASINGPKLLLELFCPSDGNLVLRVEDGSPLILTRLRDSIWAVTGGEGASGTLSIDCNETANGTSCHLSVRGQGGSVKYELNEIRLTGSSVLEIIEASFSRGSWQVQSLQRESQGRGSGLVITGGDVEIRADVTRDFTFAFDRSASMRWAFASGTIPEVIEGLENGLRSVQAAEARSTWLTYGSMTDDDGLEVVDARGLSTQQLAGQLVPDFYSSGALAGKMIDSTVEGGVVVIVTDRYPDPQLVAAKRAAARELWFIVLGANSDSEAWPQDWLDTEQALQQIHVPVLLLDSRAGSGLGDQIKNWVQGLSVEATQSSGRGA